MEAEPTAQGCPFSRQSQTHGKLKWTGNVIEWVELIYALYAARKINDGNTSLKELFQQMGEIFDIDVKEFANYFMNIKNRTDSRRTKFMDLLKDGVKWKIRLEKFQAKSFVSLKIKKGISLTPLN
jgi:hypothetical protein